MARSHEKLAFALEQLRVLQADGSRVFASDQLSRTVRERLVEHGFLQEIVRGWVISANPGTRPGDTTPWFSSFWEFCRKYSNERFGTRWVLTAEQSLFLHAERTAIPRQVILASPGANNKRLDLVFGTSLFALKKELPPAGDVMLRDQLRVYARDAALAQVTEAFFIDNPVEAAVVLANIREPTELLAHLLDAGRTTIAGRLAGAFRRMGKPKIADEIVRAMRAAGHEVRETDPFEVAPPTIRSKQPIVSRLEALWQSNRDDVLEAFPAAPGIPNDIDGYLANVDERYQLDAYHSLSIEGYSVTPELIERVTSGGWDPDNVAGDRASQDALAARGYWLAFQQVREHIAKLLKKGRPDVDALRSAHRDWYRQLFAPHVSTNLIPASMLAGYRRQPVFIRGSRHVPPRSDVVADAMSTVFDLVEREPEPIVQAVLGHWLFGYVHPFSDGNGRVARFLMNALLAGGGYPWVIVPTETRDRYLASLEVASVDGRARDFARFLAEQLKRSPKVSRRSTRRRSSRTGR